MVILIIHIAVNFWPISNLDNVELFDRLKFGRGKSSIPR